MVGPKITVECFLDIVSRSDIKTFVANKLPYGVVAEKMTCKHLTRHMVGICVPIWDLGCLYSMFPYNGRNWFGCD